MAGWQFWVDRGGTSTDVALCAGRFERAFETMVPGVRMRAPMMAINTVAPGGGAILSCGGNALLAALDACAGAQAAMRATLVASRREAAPHGLQGGADGAAGRQGMERLDGSAEVPGGRGGAELAAGEVLGLAAPGGGGWGCAAERQAA